MKKHFTVLGITLLIVSSLPLFIFGREIWIANKLSNDFDIRELYAYSEVKSPFQWEGHTIEIVEKSTGKKAELTIHDEFEGVEAGEIVELQIVMDGKVISQGDEVALSNRTVNPRYWSWLAIVEVIEKQSGDKKLALIQRIYREGNDIAQREWKVLWVRDDGTTNVVAFPYEQRSSHLLETRIIQMTGTTLMSMGYYSDIMHFYPTLFFPLLYPFGSAILGGFFLVIGFTMYFVTWILRKRRQQHDTMASTKGNV